ncbi:hypothetical protein ABBQ38_003688 [Trebouxia sp. C0009 RCD-2024]
MESFVREVQKLQPVVQLTSVETRLKSAKILAHRSGGSWQTQSDKLAGVPVADKAASKVTSRWTYSKQTVKRIKDIGHRPARSRLFSVQSSLQWQSLMMATQQDDRAVPGWPAMSTGQVPQIDTVFVHDFLVKEYQPQASKDAWLLEQQAAVSTPWEQPSFPLTIEDNQKCHLLFDRSQTGIAITDVVEDGESSGTGMEGITLADESADEVDEEGPTTTTLPQLWGSSCTTCSLYTFVQHVVWPAEMCGLVEHATYSAAASEEQAAEGGSPTALGKPTYLPTCTWLRVAGVCGLLVGLLLGYPFLGDACQGLQGLPHRTWLHLSPMGRGHVKPDAPASPTPTGTDQEQEGAYATIEADCAALQAFIAELNASKSSTAGSTAGVHNVPLSLTRSPHTQPPRTRRRPATTFAKQQRMQSFWFSVPAQLPLPWLPPPMTVHTPEGPHRTLTPPPQTLSLALVPSGALVPSRVRLMMSLGANPYKPYISPPQRPSSALVSSGLGSGRLMTPLFATPPLDFTPPSLGLSASPPSTPLALTLLPSGPRLRTPVGGDPSFTSAFAIQSTMTALAPPLSTLLALEASPVGPQRLMVSVDAPSPLGYSPPTHTPPLAVTLLPSRPRLRTPLGGHPCFGSAFAIQGLQAPLLAPPRTSERGPRFHTLPTAARSLAVYYPHQAAAQPLLLRGAPMSPAPAAVYVVCSGRCVAQLQSRSAEAALQQKNDIIQAQGVCLRAGEGVLRGLCSKVELLEATAQQADQQLGHMAHQLAAAKANWQALVTANKTLEGCFGAASLQIQRQSSMIEKQGAALHELEASRKGLRRQLHQSQEYCASQASALSRAAERSTALKAHIAELEAAAAQSKAAMAKAEEQRMMQVSRAAECTTALEARIAELQEEAAQSKAATAKAEEQRLLQVSRAAECTTALEARIAELQEEAAQSKAATAKADEEQLLQLSKAEAARQQAELNWQQAESGRQKAESARQQAESARQQAETAAEQRLCERVAAVGAQEEALAQRFSRDADNFKRQQDADIKKEQSGLEAHHQAQLAELSTKAAELAGKREAAAGHKEEVARRHEALTANSTRLAEAQALCQQSQQELDSLKAQAAEDAAKFEREQAILEAHKLELDSRAKILLMSEEDLKVRNTALEEKWQSQLEVKKQLAASEKELEEKKAKAEVTAQEHQREWGQQQSALAGREEQLQKQVQEAQEQFASKEASTNELARQLQEQRQALAEAHQQEQQRMLQWLETEKQQATQVMNAALQQKDAACDEQLKHAVAQWEATSRAAAETDKAAAETEKAALEVALAAAQAAQTQTHAAQVQAEAALAKAEAALAQADSAKVSAETAAAESVREKAAAETARAQAEHGTGIAEAARAQAEHGKGIAEAARAEAEHGKGIAEAARAQAEQEVATANSLRLQAESNVGEVEQARDSAVVAQRAAEAGLRIAELSSRVAEARRCTAEAGKAMAETAKADAEVEQAFANDMRMQAMNKVHNLKQERDSAVVAQREAEDAMFEAEAAMVRAEEEQATADDLRLAAERELGEMEEARDDAVAAQREAVEAMFEARAARVNVEVELSIVDDRRFLAVKEAETARKQKDEMAAQLRQHYDAIEGARLQAIADAKRQAREAEEAADRLLSDMQQLGVGQATEKGQGEEHEAALQQARQEAAEAKAAASAAAADAASAKEAAQQEACRHAAEKQQLQQQIAEFEEGGKSLQEALDAARQETAGATAAAQQAEGAAAQQAAESLLQRQADIKQQEEKLKKRTSDLDVQFVRLEQARCSFEAAKKKDDRAPMLGQKRSRVELPRAIYDPPHRR